MTSFAQFFSTWFRQMEPAWSPTHRETVIDIFLAHALPMFGPIDIRSLTRADVLEFRAILSRKPGRRGKPMSASRINKVMVIVCQMLNEAAVQLGFESPASGIKRLKTKRPEIHPFTLDECDRIVSSIRRDYRDYMVTRLWTGMRTGEINGLKWKHVDFTRGLIEVREVFSGCGQQEATKTELSCRDIPMLEPVRSVLEARFAHRNRENDYVFHSPRGRPIDAKNFANRIWYPLLDRLRLDKRQPYQTRHTTATILLDAGESPEWVARIMGHASTEMLFKVYSRYVPNLTRQDGSAVARLLEARRKPAALVSATDPVPELEQPRPADTPTAAD